MRVADPNRAPPHTDADLSLPALWGFSFPIVFAVVGETLVHVTDTVLLAHVGTTELAAFALVETLLELWIVPVAGLAEAAQIMIARRIGQRRDVDVGPAFRTAIGLVTVSGLVLAAALALLGPLVTDLLVSSAPVQSAVGSFLQIASLGFVFYALSLAFSGLYVGLGRPRVLIGATAVLVVTNLAISYLFVFGKLGLPRMGMNGAAVGFVAAELAALAYVVLHTVRRLDLARYGSLRQSSDTVTGRVLVRLGSPIALTVLVESVGWFGFFVIVGHVSDQALAWSTMAYAGFVLLLIPAEAFSEAVYSLVSRLVGGERIAAAAVLIRRVIVLGLAVTTPIAVIVALFPDQALSVFGAGDGGTDGAVGPLRIVAVGVLVAVPAFIWQAAVLGTGDTDAAFVIEIAERVVFLAFAALTALALDSSLTTVWTALPVSMLVGLIFSRGWFRSGRWARRAV